MALVWELPKVGTVAHADAMAEQRREAKRELREEVNRHAKRTPFSG